MIDHVRRRFAHAPRVSGGARTTTFAGVDDQEIVRALVAVGAGEAVRKDAAFEIAVEGSLDMGRWCFTVLAAGDPYEPFQFSILTTVTQRKPALGSTSFAPT